MTAELKPCPFCGRQPRLEWTSSSHSAGHCFYKCDGCGCRQDLASVEQEARGDWNRREQCK